MDILKWMFIVWRYFEHDHNMHKIWCKCFKPIGVASACFTSSRIFNWIFLLTSFGIKEVLFHYEAVKMFNNRICEEDLSPHMFRIWNSVSKITLMFWIIVNFEHSAALPLSVQLLPFRIWVKVLCIFSFNYFSSYFFNMKCVFSS